MILCDWESKEKTFTKNNGILGRISMELDPFCEVCKPLFNTF